MTDFESIDTMSAEGFTAPAPAAASPAADAPAPGGGFWESADVFVRGAADMVTFGFADEIAAAGNATIGYYFGEGSQAESWSERYNENLGIERAKDVAAAEEHPVAHTGGQIAGAFGPMPLGAARLLAGGTGLVSRAVRVGTVGAAEGALYGAGSSDGTLADRIEGAKEGAVFGGATGGVMGAISRPAMASVRAAGAAAPAALRAAPPGPAAPREFEHLAQSVAKTHARVAGATSEAAAEIGSQSVGRLATRIKGAGSAAVRGAAMTAGANALNAGMIATGGMLNPVRAAEQIGDLLGGMLTVVQKALPREERAGAMKSIGRSAEDSILKNPALGFRGAFEDATRKTLKHYREKEKQMQAEGWMPGLPRY